MNYVKRLDGVIVGRAMHESSTFSERVEDSDPEYIEFLAVLAEKNKDK